VKQLKINLNLSSQQKYHLRGWVPLLISLALFCLIISLGAIASVILWQNSLVVEKQQTKQNVERIVDAIAADLHTVDSNTLNLSNWDDTYKFVVDPKETYLQDNFDPDTSTRLGINLAVISNTAQQIIIAKNFDTATPREITFPSQLSHHFSLQPQLLIHSQISSKHQGILVLPDLPPILIASRPILTTLKQGPSRGAVVLGKFLDSHNLQQISLANRLAVRVYPVNTSDLPISIESLPPITLATTNTEQESSILILAVDEWTISSYILLKDYYDSPALVLRVDSPRTIYQQGKLSWSYLMLFIFLFGGVSMAITYRLTQEVIRYLQERELMQRELFLEKELAQVTLQSINEGIITIDRSGNIKAINPIGEKLTGCPSAFAVGRNFPEVFCIFEEQTKNALDSPLFLVLQTGQAYHSPDRDLLISSDGREFAIDYSIAPIRSSLEEIMGAVVIFRDVTESRRISQQLSWQASYDPLTGLANRREFERYLRRAVATSKREHLEHTLAFLDLDRFKIVNDTSGHIAGDEMLRQVSMLLQDNLRQTDLVARFGGDEFAILLYGCRQEEAIPVLQGLVELIKGFRFVWQDKLFTLGASMGVTTVTENSSDVTQLLSRADSACYVAKEQGRNRIYVYEPEDAQLYLPHGEMEWAGKIQQALESGGFRLYYQTIAPLQNPNKPNNSTHPKISVVASKKGAKEKPTSSLGLNQREEHYEILLRMIDEKNNVIAPGVFMPVAERYQLMPAIDRWVIKTLFEMKEIWAIYRSSDCGNHSPRGRHSLFTINLSGASLNEESFWEFLTTQITQNQIPPHLLCFEITETVAIANITKTSRFIRQMQELGCRFSLDDFGSGMSSFGYLKNLPVDYLKIDGEFIQDIVDSSTNAEIVAAIHRIGHVMGMQTIAEYVINQEVWQKVSAIGIDYAQGYYINRPQPLNPQNFLAAREVS